MDVQRSIRDVPDFPEPGVLFKDITPLLGDGATFAALIAQWAEAHRGVDVVAGVEARGFILAAPLAVRLGVGFVPVRKAGKLPGRTEQASYALEYGTATLEITADAVQPGQRVLLVDDVLATGGTVAAAAELLERLGAEVVAVQVLMELTFLPGRERLAGRELFATVAV
jgi:adenine phosphoribosyltransferase